MSKNSTEVIRKPLGASNKKPLVISSSKYKKILNTIQKEEMLKKEAEEEQRYNQYLKQGSDDMVSKWTTNLKRTQEQKQAERQQKIMDRMQKEKEEFQKIKDKDEQIRQGKINKAQELIQKLKPGPKELQSAAIQSETLKARAVQRNITKEFEASLNTRTAAETFEMEKRAMPWIEDEQKRISNSISRQNAYKAEILVAINEKSRKKQEYVKQELVENKVAQDICDQEMKAQIEKEQDMLKRKRETLRKNALEAMIMVEQRKAREQIQDTIEGNLIAVFSDGKRSIDKIRKARDAQALQNKVQRNAINAARLAAIKSDGTAAEEERYRRDVSTIQLQFTAQEKEKIQRSRQQKLARIQEYFRELNAQKEQKLRKNEETRLAMANRYKNEEVNAAFEQKLKDDKIKNKLQVKKDLTEQMEEKKKAAAEAMERDRQCFNVSFEKEDNFFFDYANTLVADAVSKERPLRPFLKAVEQYKKDNDIGPDYKLPPQLEANLRLARTEGDEGLLSPGGTNVRKYGLDELKDLNPYLPECQ